MVLTDPLTEIRPGYICQGFFSNFNNFLKRMLRIVTFPKITQIRQELWVHEVVNLFVYNPFKNFCLMEKYTKGSITFHVLAIISYYSFQNKVTGRLFLVRHGKSFSRQ